MSHRAGLPYRIHHRLWETRTAVVYHGEHESTAEPVLIRILKLADDSTKQAWREEVDLLGQADGTPAVASLLERREDWPRAPLTVYRHQELLGPLRTWLGAVAESVEPLLKVSVDVLTLLAALHGKGIVVGNLNSESLCIDSAGDVVLLDMGRIVSGTDAAVNRYGYRRRVPEAAPAEPADDLYAWGMIMRTFLKGHPLDGESEDEIRTRLLQGNLPVEVGVAPDWVKRQPRELMGFVGKLLQGQFDSAEAALKALRAFYKPRMAAEPLEVLQQNGVELEATLGQGGMGTVYRGRVKASGQRVAVKVMLDGASRDRFLAEAAMLEKLNHPNVVRFRDLYDWEVEEETSYILLMEYAPGLPLDVWFEMVHRDVRQLGGVFSQLLETLSYIHEQGYVHRDVKPANIIVGPGGRLKLLDFGLVKDRERALTRTGEGLGTLTYMAPEQAKEAATVDGRVDLYAAGVLLAKLLCGTGRFANEAQMQTFESLFLPEGFLGAREQGLIVPGPMPPGLVAFIEKCAAPEPADRFDTARHALFVWNRLVEAGCVRGGHDDLYPRVGLHNRAPMLRQLWANLLVDPQPAAAVVHGVPGCGKTRVLHEQIGWVLLQGEADVLWVDGVQRLGELLAVEANPVTLVHALEQKALQKPLLVCLDTNQAAHDEATLDLLSRIGHSRVPCRLLVVGTASTSATLPPTQWRTPVRVEALVPHEVNALIRGMLSAKTIEDNLYEALMAASNGIIGVLVRLIAELEENVHYVMFPDTGHAALKPFAHLPVPEGAVRLLAPLLDDLDDDRTRFVSGLGVMGETIPLELYERWLSQCFGEISNDATTTTRRRAIRFPFIELLPSAGGMRAFSPRLLAHAAAAEASAADRVGAHRIGAAYYEAQMGRLLPNVHDHARELVVLCRERVRHLQGAGDQSWLQWAAQGTDWALAVGDFAQAERWMDAAIETLSTAGDSPLLVECLARRATALGVQSKRGPALVDAERAVALCEQFPQSVLLVASYVPTVFLETGRAEEALKLIQRGLALAEGAEVDAFTKARLWFRYAYVPFYAPALVAWSVGLEAAQRARSLSNTVPVPETLNGTIANIAGLLFLRLNSVDDAVREWEGALALPNLRPLDHSHLLSNVGLAYWTRRLEAKAAIEVYSTAIKTARAEGLPEALWYHYTNVGFIESRLGERNETVQSRFETALQSLGHRASPVARATIGIAQAQAFLAVAMYPEAEDLFHRVHELTGDRNPELATYSFSGLAHIRILTGRISDASSLLDQAAEIAHSRGNGDHKWQVSVVRLLHLTALDIYDEDAGRRTLDALSELYPTTTLRYSAAGRSVRDSELLFWTGVVQLLEAKHEEGAGKVREAWQALEALQLKGYESLLALSLGAVVRSHRTILGEAVREVCGEIFGGVVINAKVRGLKGLQKELEALQRTVNKTPVVAS